jgi:hypothetical protein
MQVCAGYLNQQAGRTVENIRFAGMIWKSQVLAGRLRWDYLNQSQVPA